MLLVSVIKLYLLAIGLLPITRTRDNWHVPLCMELLFVLMRSGVSYYTTIINPKAENFPVFSVNADTIFSNVSAINPHPIILLLCKISI